MKKHRCINNIQLRRQEEQYILVWLTAIVCDYIYSQHFYSLKNQYTVPMGANRFLKLGRLELDSRERKLFFKAPQFISKPP